MTRHEAIRQARQVDTLVSLGFTRDEADSLRRISMTLHRWAEHECNGTIQRDGDDGDGLPFWFNANSGRKLGRAPDRERGALKRLRTIIAARNIRTYVMNSNYYGLASNAVQSYVQGDPRVAALYILRPGDVPEGKDINGYYTHGIAVY